MIECVCVSLGGLAALMYTDTFQTFVIIAGALVLTGFCKYDLCNNIFSYLMNPVLNSHDRRSMLSACLKPWCPEAAQAGKRLTRVRNHSFYEPYSVLTLQNHRKTLSLQLTQQLQPY